MFSGNDISHRSGHVNFQNERPPMVNHIMILHSGKVGVWCIMNALMNTGTVVSSETINLH